MMIQWTRLGAAADDSTVTIAVTYRPTACPLHSPSQKKLSSLLTRRQRKQIKSTRAGPGRATERLTNGYL